MNLTAEKNEIIQWVNSLENPTTIEKIKQLKRAESFDFEKEWKRGITVSEAKERTRKFIESLPWKK